MMNVKCEFLIFKHLPIPFWRQTFLSMYTFVCNILFRRLLYIAHLLKCHVDTIENSMFSLAADWWKSIFLLLFFFFLDLPFSRLEHGVKWPKKFSGIWVCSTFTEFSVSENEMTVNFMCTKKLHLEVIKNVTNEPLICM